MFGMPCLFLRHTLRHVCSSQRLHSGGHSHWYSRGLPHYELVSVTQRFQIEMSMRLVLRGFDVSDRGHQCDGLLSCIAFRYLVLSPDSMKVGSFYIAGACLLQSSRLILVYLHLGKKFRDPSPCSSCSYAMWLLV